MNLLNRTLVLFFFLFLLKASQAQLSGTYTVGGSSPNFPTLDSAFNFMEKNGISGNVYLKVRSGRYTLRTTIDSIKGANASNKIKVGPDANNTSPVVFWNKNTSSTSNYLVNIRMGYLEFDSIEFRVDSTSAHGKIIDITRNCNNVIFDGCIFYGRDTLSTSSNFYIISDGTTVKVNNLKVKNCVFYNGSISISHSGASNLDEIGLEIINNLFLRFAYSAISIQYQKSTRISHNYLRGLNKNYNCTGIWLVDCDSSNVENNQVYLNGGISQGIGLTRCNGSIKAPNLITNNLISFYDSSNSASSTGLYITGGLYNYVFFNTVLNTSLSSTSKCAELVQATSGQNCNFMNNNLIHTGAGYAIYLSSMTGISAMDYNNYYSAGSYLGYLNTSSITNLSALKTATSKNVNSISYNTSFKNNLKLLTDSRYLNGSGTPITGIKLDFEGGIRNPVSPDIGADEFSPFTLDAALIFVESDYCMGTQNVYVTLQNAASSAITSVKINWQISVNGSSYTTQNPITMTTSLKYLSDSVINIATYTFNRGSVYRIKAWVSAPNNGTDEEPKNDTLISPIIKIKIKGTYTLGGSSPDFPTIDSAFRALSSVGVCGPVRFNLKSGTYKEFISINNIPGASLTNTITLGPHPSNSSKPVITNSSTASNNNWIINFRGTSHVSIDSIGIINTGTAYGRVIVFNGVHNYITFLADSIASAIVTSTSDDFAVIYDMLPKNQNNFLTIQNCKILNGTYGIYLHGFNNTKPGMGSRILNNRIENFYWTGIELHYQTNTQISYNYIKEKAAWYGINLFDIDTCQVIGNQVYLGGADAPRGILFANCDGSSKKPSICANNVISLYNPKIYGDACGLAASEGNFNKIAYNSINLANGSYFSVAMAATYGGGDSADIYNNTASNMGKGYAWSSDYTQGIRFSDYNNLYSVGSPDLAYYGRKLKDLDALKKLSGMQSHSISKDPKYTSGYDLRPKQTALKETAKPLSYIQTDITGKVRDSISPDIGAYQFTPIDHDLSIIHLLYDSITPCGNDSVTYRVIIENSGYSAQTNFDIKFEVNYFSSLYYQSTFTYKDTLQRLKLDTITFGPFKTSFGGNFSVRAFTKLGNDYDRRNDTMFSAFSLTAIIDPPDSKVDTVCSNATYKMSIPSSGYLHTWYSSASAPKPIKVGDTLTVSPIKDTQYYIAKRSAYYGQGQFTTYKTTCTYGSPEGIMFDITPSVPLRIDSLSTMFIFRGTQKVRIFIKKGSYKGYEKKPSAWTIKDSAICNSLYSSLPATIVPTKKHEFDKDSTYGIYLNYEGKYNSTTNCNCPNPHIKITDGPELYRFFGDVRNTVGYTGTIYYSHSYCESKRSTYDVKVTKPTVSLRSDTSYCSLNGIKLTANAGAGFKSYLWSDGSSKQSITVTKAGIYAVNVKDKFGCTATDDFVVTENKNPVVAIGNDTSYCKSNGIQFNLTARSGFKSYFWNTGSNKESIPVDTAGIYMVRVTDNKGCNGTDTLKVSENADPVINLGNDTIFCSKEGIIKILDPGSQFSKYLWSTSDISQTLTVKSPGIYSVNVVDTLGCEGKDLIYIFEKQNPEVSLGYDTAYCAKNGITKTLRAGKGFDEYRWSTGDLTESMQITQKGTYWVKVGLEGCSDYDTIQIYENSNPVVDLGLDREVDPDKLVNELLDAGAGYRKYFWSTLEQRQTIVAKEKGIYWVRVNDDNGCTGSDTLEIKFRNKIGVHIFEQGGIRVYPNPAVDVLNIESENLPITSVSLIDMRGRTVLKERVKGLKISVSTSGLSGGIYVLNIQSDKIVNTIKVHIAE